MIQGAGYYLLRCIFDPGMLPLPPTFQANKIRVRDLESILAEVKKENTYLEKLVGKGNAKSIRDDVQKEANTVCQGRQEIGMNFCNITSYNCTQKLRRNTTPIILGLDFSWT